MAKKLEYTLSDRIDPVLAQQFKNDLVKHPRIIDVSVDPETRHLIALCSDDISPDELINEMRRLGWPPEFQRAGFLVQNATGPHVAFRLRRLPARVPGLKDVRFNPCTGLIWLKYDRNRLDPTRIKELLASFGLKAMETGAISLVKEVFAARTVQLLRKSGLSLAFLAMVLLAEHFGKLRLAGLAGSVGLLWSAWFLVKRSFGLGLHMVIDRSLMGLLVAFAGLAYSIAGLFNHWQPMFSEVMALVVGLIWWEIGLNYLSKKALGDLVDMMQQMPRWAKVKMGNALVEVPAEDVEQGAVVRLGPGDETPGDGVVETGKAETSCGPVAPGAEIRVPCRVISGQLDIRITARFNSCLHMRSLLLLEEALSSGSTSTAHAIGLALGYAVLLGLAGGAWIMGYPHMALLAGLPLVQGLNLAADWHRAAAVKKAARARVIFRSGHRLHHIARAKTLLCCLGSVLDRYTLTAGADPQAVEATSAIEHTLLSKLRQAFEKPKNTAGQLRHYLGMGAEGTVGSKHWRVGNGRFITRAKPHPAEADGLFAVYAQQSSNLHTLLFRRQARAGADRLFKAFKHKVLVSSASGPTVSYWARKWKVSETYPRAVPQGKVQVLESLNQKGRKVFYVEDEPYNHHMHRLAFWSVAIAQKHVNLELADTVILGSSLEPVKKARTIAKRSNMAKILGVFLVWASLVLAAAGLWFGVLPGPATLLLAYGIMFGLALL